MVTKLTKISYLEDYITFVSIHNVMQDLTGNLTFRGQRVFLHNTSGWFGAVPLEASGDFGINPMDGEYHIMCQVQNDQMLFACNCFLKTIWR
jgi:hypothetical protein